MGCPTRLAAANPAAPTPYFAAGDWDGVVRVWDLSVPGDYPLWRTNGLKNARIDAITFSHDGKLLATGGTDCVIRVWDAASGQLVSKFDRHTASVRAITFSADGHLAASCSHDRAGAAMGSAERGIIGLVFGGHVNLTLLGLFSGEVSHIADDDNDDQDELG